MRWLLFLSRLAFICNVCFLLSLSLQFNRWLQHTDAESTIIIIGYFMVVLFNPIVNLCYLILLVGRRAKLAIVPLWLLLSNFVFLILQIIYIIYLNGTQHS